MTLSSLLWVCLGLWVAIDCFVVVRLVVRPTISENVEPVAFDVISTETQG
jgi:multisubunit Na+/H+ antiporter MnhF subunit